jgi:3-hydroxybutyryl-CoA dehydrogenase
MSIDTVAVVGSGTMGTGLVETIASRGHRVLAIRASGGDPAEARARLGASLEKRVKKGKLDAAARDALLARVEHVDDLACLEEADLVIESAVEDMATKLELLTRLEAHMTPGAILATNTSSLPLLELCERVERPERLLGLHFFNPVTDTGVIVAAQAFVEGLGKTPVAVSASPGYVVNRLLVPYLLQAMETLEGGTAGTEAIDTAMRLGCGHPMGPLALADFIGLDVVMAMAKSLHHELRQPRYRPPSILRRLVLARELGRKSGLGFYDYRSGKPIARTSLLPEVPRRVLAEAAE